MPLNKNLHKVMVIGSGPIVIGVDGDTLPADKGYVSFVNANDGTCEGINYTCCNAFSVQFHPEACAGPLDTQFLFDRFIEKMEEK